MSTNYFKPGFILMLLFFAWGTFAEAQSTHINNDTVDLKLNHNTGNITDLILKTGSGKDIIDPYWGQDHAGVCRLNYENTTLLDFEETRDTAWYYYESSYGRKLISLDWHDDFELTMEWVLNQPVNDWYCSFNPGGDISSGTDYCAAEMLGGGFRKYVIPYPGPWTLIWGGMTTCSAYTDTRYPEAFGYRFLKPTKVRLANGASTDHYIHNLQPGHNVVKFGLQNTGGNDWTECIAKMDFSNTEWLTSGGNNQRTAYATTAFYGNSHVRAIALGRNPGCLNAYPTVTDDTIYAGGLGNILRAYDSKTLQEKWPAPFIHTDPLSSVDIYKDYLLVGTEGRILILDRHAGTLIREVMHSGLNQCDGTAIYDGIAYRSYIGCGFFAFDIESGDILWDWSDPNSGYSCYKPSLSEDGTKVVTNNMYGYYYCLDTQNGNLLWTYDSGVHWGCGLSVICNDNVLFMVGKSVGVAPELVCLDLETGTENWRVPTTMPPGDVRNIAVHNNRIYCPATGSNDLICLDMEGNHLWSYATGGDVGAPVISGNGRVIFPSLDGRLYVADARSSNIITSRDLNLEAHGFSAALYRGAYYVYMKIDGEWYLCIIA